MANIRFKPASGMEAEWREANPVLLKGELAIETDTSRWKFGDGVHAYLDLPYATAGVGQKGDRGDPGPKGDTGAKGDQGWIIRGAFSSVEELPKSGTIGEAYLVGSDVWMWDPLGGRFVNLGAVQGAQGPAGPRGAQGERGAPGVAASIEGGIARSLDSDAVPTVQNVGSATNAKFSFGIPRGAPGAPGAQGPRGFSFSPVVSAEGVLSWSNDGNLENPVPVSIKGDKGDPGTVNLSAVEEALEKALPTRILCGSSDVGFLLRTDIEAGASVYFTLEANGHSESRLCFFTGRVNYAGAAFANAALHSLSAMVLQVSVFVIGGKFCLWIPKIANGAVWFVRLLSDSGKSRVVSVLSQVKPSDFSQSMDLQSSSLLDGVLTRSGGSLSGPLVASASDWGVAQVANAVRVPVGTAVSAPDGSLIFYYE